MRRPDGGVVESGVFVELRQTGCGGGWLRHAREELRISVEPVSADQEKDVMEPPCRICTRLAPPTTSELHRTLQGRYKSSVTRRREYCEPRRCHAKVGTDLKSEFHSRSYDVDRIVNKIQELRRNVQDVGELKRHDKTKKIQRKSPSSSATEITDVTAARRTVENCLREMTKVKAFLEDDNSWWKILKSRSVDCCHQKVPHLHGLLDGSSVTLMLLEEEADEVPRRFMTSTPKKRSDIAGFSFRTSSKESTSEMNYTEQGANPSKEDTQARTASCYSIDMKSALIEVASIDRHNPTEQYAKRDTRSKQGTAPLEFLTEVREDRSNMQKPSKSSSRRKDTVQYENKEKRTDRSNVVSPREIWYGQTMPEDTLRPRETFSSENTGGIKHIDFESNVDLSTELPSRNTAGHKPRAKPITERCVQHTQKLLSKISRTRSRD
ncbi:uncharacterized protein LOC113562700 [Ooceraea biroi]|uniref:uncharacterized protein LOC113562700 n=1 Tax=Ooceraea biroi TaxID=2015173 RepID=UPI000F079563|nr:uncharacterized protein LOC113562700 [Ooceraea biroi]